MTEFDNRPLAGKIAVVIGASRGAGRGIAIELGDAGAMVYAAARSTKGSPTWQPGDRDTVEDTAELIESRGGTAVAVKVDALDLAEMSHLFERIKAEHGGLDILVNSAWEDLWFWQQTFWEHDLDKGLRLVTLGLHAPLIAAHFAAPLMFGRRNPLIVTMTDVERDGCVYYRLVKGGVRKMTEDMALELKDHGVSAIALRSGYMAREIVEGPPTTDPEFEKRHSPRFNGRAVVALSTAANRMEKSGVVVDVSDLAFEYGFTDIDGRQPLMFC